MIKSLLCVFFLASPLTAFGAMVQAHNIDSNNIYVGVNPQMSVNADCTVTIEQFLADGSRWLVANSYFRNIPGSIWSEKTQWQTYRIGKSSVVCRESSESILARQQRDSDQKRQAQQNQQNQQEVARQQRLLQQQRAANSQRAQQAVQAQQQSEQQKVDQAHRDAQWKATAETNQRAALQQQAEWRAQEQAAAALRSQQLQKQKAQQQAAQIATASALGALAISTFTAAQLEAENNRQQELQLKRNESMRKEKLLKSASESPDVNPWGVQ